MKGILFVLLSLLYAGSVSAQSLEELLERWLNRPGAEGRVQLLPGRLPDNRPEGFVLPEGRLIGSIQRPDGFEIFYDSTAAPQASLEQYRQLALSKGWRIVGNRFRGWGFIGIVGDAQNFCQPEQGWMLSVSVTPGKNGTDLRLYGSKASRCPDVQSTAPELPPIPVFFPPSGVPITNQRAGGGGDEFSSQATLATELSAAELLRHFGSQLEAARWVRLEADKPGLVGTSFWTYRDTDKEWFAILVVLADDARSPKSRVARIIAFVR